MTIQRAHRVNSGATVRAQVSRDTRTLAAMLQPTVACAPMGSAKPTPRTTSGLLFSGAVRAVRWISAAQAILHVAARAALAQGAAIPEARLDLLVARSAALHVAAAVGFRSGVYVRPTLVVAAGPAWRHDSAGTGGRVEALARFVLDPFRESRVGLYAQGGLTALYDPWDRWRGALSVAVGAELPARAGGAWAVEVGLGGGVRFGLALRGAAPGRR